MPVIHRHQVGLRNRIESQIRTADPVILLSPRVDLLHNRIAEVSFPLAGYFVGIDRLAVGVGDIVGVVVGVTVGVYVGVRTMITGSGCVGCGVGMAGSSPQPISRISSTPSRRPRPFQGAQLIISRRHL